MTQTHLPPYWAERLCRTIGAGPGPENVRFLHAWAAAEGGTAEWNPLNTEFDLPGATNYNTAGVKNYPRPTWGVCATVLTLTNGNYGKIVGHLQAGTYTAEQIVDDCDAQIRTWGTNPDTIRAVLAA